MSITNMAIGRARELDPEIGEIQNSHPPNDPAESFISCHIVLP
jgi:hypothetical protein